MLSDDDKMHITCRLKVMFDGMRSLPSPGFYGSVIKGSIPHRLFYTNPISMSARYFQTTRQSFRTLVSIERIFWFAKPANIPRKKVTTILHSWTGTTRFHSHTSLGRRLAGKI